MLSDLRNRISVAAIAEISIPENLDDHRRWTKDGWGCLLSDRRSGGVARDGGTLRVRFLSAAKCLVAPDPSSQ
jgi:hypothetical protein